MNWIDLLLIAVLLLCAWNGWAKGFLQASADILVSVGSLLLSFCCYAYLAERIGKIARPSPWIVPLSFLFCLILFGWLLAWMVRLIFRHIPRNAHYSRWNHVFGVIPGIVNGCIWATVVSLLIVSLPVSDTISAQAESSRVAAKLTQPAQWLEEKLSPVFDDAVHRTLTKMTVNPESEKSVKLPFHTTHVTERPDLEAEMLDLVNAERTRRGIRPLRADTALRRVAIAYSKEMFARGYFSHYTPENQSPFDRMKAAHIHFLTAGENLALARTLTLAHDGLMNSPGHRANILNPAYGRLGIGIADGGLRGLMVSQEFRN